MNIFGKEPGDYALQRALDEDGELNAYHRAHNARTGVHTSETEVWNALGAGVPAQYERAGQDAQAYGYLTNNLLAIQAEIDEVLYTSYRLPEWVAINTSINEGAEAYAIRVTDRDGRADRIDDTTGTAAPSAVTAQTLVQQPLHWYGLDAQWSLNELRAAMLGGHPLESSTIRATIDGHLETLDAVALDGGGYQGATGLLNHPIASPTPAEDRAVSSNASKTFATATTEEIRTMINNEISKLISESKEVVGRILTEGMTVYLPIAQYSLMSDKYVMNTDKSLMKSMMDDNPWTTFTGKPLNFVQVAELDDKMIVSLKSSRVCEMGVSIMPRVVKVMDAGRWFKVQTESKFSELFVKRPNLIRYTTGI